MKMKMVCLAAFCLLFGCYKPADTKRPPPPVTVIQPKKIDAPLYLDYVGHLEANISVAIKPQVAGILTGKFFIEGQDVKAGELLLTIDDRPFTAALEKAHGILDQNVALLQYSEAAVRGYSKLVQDEYVSRLNFDQYITNVRVNEATIEQSRADVETAQVNLSYCSIAAPMDSVTGLLQVKVGNFVDPSSNQTLIVLNQIKPILASFYIPEKDLTRIQEQQNSNPLKVEVFLYEDDSRAFDGTLTLINNQVEENTGTILLQATVPNEEKILWPGAFVNARIHLGVKKDALLVPSQAVLFSPLGPYIYIVKSDHTAEMRLVTLGERIDEQVIIEKGLQENETVVLEGQINLAQGIEVAVRAP